MSTKIVKQYLVNDQTYCVAISKIIVNPRFYELLKTVLAIRFVRIACTSRTRTSFFFQRLLASDVENTSKCKQREHD